MGCGANDPKDSAWINCDLYLLPNVDICLDLLKGFPIKTNSVGQILANHVLEHLVDPLPFFKEAWRVLVHGGQMILRLPHGATNAAYCDITHVRFWVPGTFCFLQPGYGKQVFNPQHDNWKEYFVVESVYTRVNPKLRWLCKFPLRQLGAMRLLDYLWNGYCEMIASLRAVKEEATVAKFNQISQGNFIPVTRCMYQHELEGRTIKPGEPMHLVHFDTSGTGFPTQET